MYQITGILYVAFKPTTAVALLHCYLGAPKKTKEHSPQNQ